MQKPTKRLLLPESLTWQLGENPKRTLPVACPLSHYIVILVVYMGYY